MIKSIPNPAAVALILLLGAASSSALAQTARKPLSRTEPTAGLVDGDTYRNSSLGLELKAAPSLRFGPPSVRGVPGSVPLLVTIAALNGRDFSSSTRATVFYAEDLGYYRPDLRSTQAYVNRVVRSQITQGLELVKGAGEQRVGDVRFARADFRRTGQYQIVLIKACKAYAFVFIFAAPSPDGANAILTGTHIALAKTGLGCADDH
jgi:hypothetical protein